MRRLLLVGPDFGVLPGGSCQPGGLALFSRCVARALAGSDLEELVVWSLLDTQAAMSETLADFVRAGAHSGLKWTCRGFGGGRARLGLAFVRCHRRFDHTMFLHMGVGQLANAMLGRPHSLWLVGIEARSPLPLTRRRVVARATPLLCISKFSGTEMLRFNPGLPSAHAVHLCVEPDAAWTAEPASQKYAAAEREPAVLVVGRLAASERYKGHDQLIAAWPHVVARCPSAELWIVGDGDDRDRLQGSAQALPERVANAIKFLGRLSDADLQDRYARSRVFAMPSTGEGFGLVFVEAMRFGVPCICSEDSAAEIVAHGRTGFVVKQEARGIAEACVRLLLEDDLADGMSVEGRRRYEERFRFPAFRDRLLVSMGLQPAP